MLRSDLEAMATDRRLLECNRILAQISLVQTKTMNIELTTNPITVITKFIPEDTIFKILKRKKLNQFFALLSTAQK